MKNQETAIRMGQDNNQKICSVIFVIFSKHVILI